MRDLSSDSNRFFTHEQNHAGGKDTHAGVWNQSKFCRDLSETELVIPSEHKFPPCGSTRYVHFPSRFLSGVKVQAYVSKILVRQLIKSLEFLNRILYCTKAVNCFRILPDSWSRTVKLIQSCAWANEFCKIQVFTETTTKLKFDVMCFGWKFQLFRLLWRKKT